MIKLFKWLFRSSHKPVIENINLCSKLVEFENRIEKLEEDNIETNNLFYEIMENIRALDARIDILKEHEIDV